MYCFVVIYVFIFLSFFVCHLYFVLQGQKHILFYYSNLMHWSKLLIQTVLTCLDMLQLRESTLYLSQNISHFKRKHVYLDLHYYLNIITLYNKTHQFKLTFLKPQIYEVKSDYSHVKPQILFLFKEEVQDKFPNKVWISSVIDYLCPAKL